MRAAALAALLLAGCAGAPSRRAPAADPAAWHRGAVVYGVVPPLFGDPPLRAVTARLDALRDLGVDALWIAPVQATDDLGAISYATTDYFALRPDYGTPEDLKALVRAAHARRIRVLLDFVPNHTSVGHPWYVDAERRGRASPYWSFYVRDASGEAAWDFDWKHLRKLDYANPAVRRTMIDAFVHWVREYDVDGYRVDAAWGIRDRAPDFWPEVIAALRAVKPDVFLLAEASARDAFYVRSGFDAAYDWTEQLGRWAWQGIFEDPAHLSDRLAAAVAPEATPRDRVFRFLDNNDTGARFATRHGVETARVAAVLVHALPGLASIFTGEEVGAAYEPYEDPPPVDWRDPHGLRPWYARLAGLREELPALRDGGYRRLEVPGEPDVFAFLRDAGTGGRAVVIANFGDRTRLRLALPAGGGPAPTFDALSRREAARAPAGGELELDLPARTAVILVPKPS